MSSSDTYDYLDVINRSIENPVTYARWCVDNKILCAATEPVERPLKSIQARSLDQSTTHCAVNSDALGRYNSTMIDIQSRISSINTMLSTFNMQDIRLNPVLLKARSDVDNLVVRVNSMPVSLTRTCCGDTSTALSKSDGTCCSLNQSNSFICVCGRINNQLTKPYLDANGTPQCNVSYGCMYEPYSTGYGNVINGVLSCKCTSNAVWNPISKKCEPLPSRACPLDASKVVNSIGLSPTDSIHVSIDSSKCIDLHAGNIADRTPFQIYDCNNTNAQHFRYNRATKQIVHTSSGKCLDVRNNNDSVNNPIHLWPCDRTGTNQAQRFTLDNMKGHIVWDGSSTGRRIGVSQTDVYGRTTSSGSSFINDQAIVLMDPSSSNRQVFNLDRINPPCIRCENNMDCPDGNMCVQLFGVTTCVPKSVIDISGPINKSAWIEIISSNFNATLTRSHLSESWYQTLPNITSMSTIYLRVRPILVTSIGIVRRTLFGSSTMFVNNVLFRRNGNMLKIMETLGGDSPLVPALFIPPLFRIQRVSYDNLLPSIRDLLNLNTSVVRIVSINNERFITRNSEHYVPRSLSTDRIDTFNSLEATPRFTTYDINNVAFTYMTNEWCPLAAGFYGDRLTATWYPFITNLSVYEIDGTKFPLELELVLMQVNSWSVVGRMNIIICNTFDIMRFLWDMGEAGGQGIFKNYYTVYIPYNQTFDVFLPRSSYLGEYMMVYGRATNKFTSVGNSNECFKEGNTQITVNPKIWEGEISGI
jgi:hypothetical protein